MTILTVLAERRLRRAEISCPAFEKTRSLGTDVATTQSDLRARGTSSRYTVYRELVPLAHTPVYHTPALVLSSTLVDRLAVQYSFQNVTWAAGH